MRDPALVIFDSDGVLVDSEPLAARVMAEYATELGLPMSPEDAIDRFTGFTLDAVKEKLEAALGRPLPDDFKREVRERDYAAFRASLRAMPGVRETLARLTAPRCIASSGSFEKLAVTLRVTGLEALFAPHIFSAVQVARGKPAPISDAEADRILRQVQEGIERPKPSITFEIGEQVKVREGPFETFTGLVEEVDEERSRLKVAVSIFGRATPVELEFTQVSKQG